VKMSKGKKKGNETSRAVSRRKKNSQARNSQKKKEKRISRVGSPGTGEGNGGRCRELQMLVEGEERRKKEKGRHQRRKKRERVNIGGERTNGRLIVQVHVASRIQILRTQKKSFFRTDAQQKESTYELASKLRGVHLTSCGKKLGKNRGPTPTESGKQGKLPRFNHPKSLKKVLIGKRG